MVAFDHTVIAAREKEVSAAFLARILGLQVGEQHGPFLPVETGNGVKLYFRDAEPERRRPLHYAFLVSEEEFDAILSRLGEEEITHFADPFHKRPNEINDDDGGRGMYFDDPDEHNLEVITRPYGSGG